jgi:hypothetical protein
LNIAGYSSCQLSTAGQKYKNIGYFTSSHLSFKVTKVFMALIKYNVRPPVNSELSVSGRRTIKPEFFLKLFNQEGNILHVKGMWEHVNRSDAHHVIQL